MGWLHVNPVGHKQIQSIITIRSCARHGKVHEIMKKMLFSFAMLMTMVATVSVFANAQTTQSVQNMHASPRLHMSLFRGHTAVVPLDVVALGSLQSPMVMFGSKLTASIAATRRVSTSKKWHL